MRYIHISKPLVTIKAQDGTMKTIVTPARGNTLNVGSNQRKAALFIAKKAAKAARRAAKSPKSITEIYEASLNACADFDAEKIAQEAEAA